ncbi:MerR family transcriptional regulator [Bacillus sp. Bva_UNVM-123]|uniref:MerR family transcriptional regulator n=1 Tax=Bacillus sp. Bva_UNVM-123 TaxID=2829798 RepID=UPI00391F67FE
MRIGEVSKRCKLTKKAISYYEKEGLLEKKYDSNGYRTYDDIDVILLKKVFILRKLGMGVSDIKAIILHGDMHAALQAFQEKQKFQISQLKAQHDYILYYLNHSLSVDEAFNDIEQKLDHYMLIKDKLLQCFPGYFGKYLYVHFGPFLEGEIDSSEKLAAFNRIVDYLDNVKDVSFPHDIQEYLTEQIGSLTEISKIDTGVCEALKDYDHFKIENDDWIRVYLEYRNSEEYKLSPAYKLQQLMINFQKNSGYSDIFIPNLKILSESYKNYHDRLNEFNEKFIADYPEAEKLRTE